MNELVIGLKDKDRFNASQPKNDAQFATYVTNPTLPAILEILFGGAGVKAPTLFPRTDLVAAFLTGVSGLNANGSVAEMLRLNTNTAPTPAGAQNNLGVIGGDTAGFPNGRRPGDDVVDIALRVVMGKLLPLADAPSGQLPFTDGALVDASHFATTLPLPEDAAPRLAERHSVAFPGRRGPRVPAARSLSRGPSRSVHSMPPMLTRRLLLFVALASLCARPIRAHDFWIEPSAYRVDKGAALGVGLRVGEGYRGDPVARNPAKIRRFVLVGPAGEQPIAGDDGQDPAGRAELRKPGLFVIGYHSWPSPITLEAAKFEAYLREEGLERIIALRAERQRECRARARDLFALRQGARHLWSVRGRNVPTASSVFRSSSFRKPTRTWEEAARGGSASSSRTARSRARSWWRSPKRNPRRSSRPARTRRSCRVRPRGGPHVAREVSAHGAGAGGLGRGLGEPLGLADLRDPGAT